MPASVLQIEEAESARVHDEADDELLLAPIDAAETVRSDALNQSEQLENTDRRVEEEAAEVRAVQEHAEPPFMILTEEEPHARDEDLLHFKRVLE